MSDNDTAGDFINCVFVGNSVSVYYGGALCNQGATGTVTNCIFVGNKNDNDGGAVFNYNSDMTFSNCIFADNITGDKGGGMYNHSISPANADPTIINCIFWNNEDIGGINENSQIYNGPDSTAIVSYSCIQDDDPDDAAIPYGGATNNNLDDNPLFERAPNDGGDGWGDTNDDYGDVHLSHNSPYIDIGNNTGINPDTADLNNDGDTNETTPLDLDMRPRVLDDICNDTYTGSTIDMGAYEFAWIYLGDLDGDCDVDLGDYSIFSGHWLSGIE